MVGGVGEGLEEAGIDAFEDDAGEALGDALFVAAALVEGGFQKGGGGARRAQKGRTAKEQVEGAEVVLVVGWRGGPGGRPRKAVARGRVLLVVEPPDGAVGENAPAEVAVGDGVGLAEVAKNLGVG